jgi:hypothetical protein
MAMFQFRSYLSNIVLDFFVFEEYGIFSLQLNQVEFLDMFNITSLVRFDNC